VPPASRCWGAGGPLCAPFRDIPRGPPGIRVDLGQRHIGVGDAEQIIKQQQILRVGVGHTCPHLCACGGALELSGPDRRAQ
jgi:hypothetical protein